MELSFIRRTFETSKNKKLSTVMGNSLMTEVNKKAWELIKAKKASKKTAYEHAWKCVRLAKQAATYLNDKVDATLVQPLANSFGAYNMRNQENLVDAFGLELITELVKKGILMQRGQYMAGDPGSSRNNWYYLPVYGISYRELK